MDPMRRHACIYAFGDFKKSLLADQSEGVYGHPRIHHTHDALTLGSHTVSREPMHTGRENRHYCMSQGLRHAAGLEATY